jgi:hypothetical protein
LCRFIVNSPLPVLPTELSSAEKDFIQDFQPPESFSKQGIKAVGDESDKGEEDSEAENIEMVDSEVEDHTEGGSDNGDENTVRTLLL